MHCGPWDRSNQNRQSMNKQAWRPINQQIDRLVEDAVWGAFATKCHIFARQNLNDHLPFFLFDIFWAMEDQIRERVTSSKH